MGHERQARAGDLPAGREHVFLGREIAEPRDFSEYTARLIDGEVRQIVSDMEEKAEKTLAQHQDQLNTLAEALLEQETLQAEEVDRLLGFDVAPREVEAPVPEGAALSPAGPQRA